MDKMKPEEVSPLDLIEQIRKLEAKNFDLEKKINGHLREDNEIEQVLGKALGYPRYRDDPKNFPNVTDDSVCVGDHVPVTIAMAAAKQIDLLKNALLALSRPKQFERPCFCRTMANLYCVGQDECKQAREALKGLGVGK